MDDNYFLMTAGGALPSDDLDPSWPSFHSATADFDCLFPGKPSDCFPDHNSHISTTDRYSSMLSSSNSHSLFSGDNFGIRQLIGKLGAIGNAGGASQAAVPLYVGGGNNFNSAGRTSCYGTTSSVSRPKPPLPMDQLHNLGNSMALHSPLSDPAFAARAAKFSGLGSRSFNGRIRTPFGSNTNEPTRGSNAALQDGGIIQRVSSSPCLRPAGSSGQHHNMETIPVLSPGKKPSDSLEKSSVSDQKPSDLNPRKRKAKSKEDAPAQSGNSGQGAENDDDDQSNAKRLKGTEIENGAIKTDEEPRTGATEAGEHSGGDEKTNPKAPEPPKDYIHVRARRGQATDSHSLAERVRREKISERMKLLQDLVPGCNKVTGKALMLDEIINYVQSLQRQVEFLSMKLASVNTRLDANMDDLVPKDNGSMAHQMYQVESFYGQQTQQCPQLEAAVPNGSLGQCTIDPLGTTICLGKVGLQLPPIASISDALPQLPTLCEDELQSIVQMGFGRNPSRDSAVIFPDASQISYMKNEL